MTTYNINSGPSKFDLMTALFDREKTRVVTFNLDRNLVMIANVDSVAVKKDPVDKGESWEIRIYTRSLSEKGSFRPYRNQYVGWYSTKSRSGQLTTVK